MNLHIDTACNLNKRHARTKHNLRTPGGGEFFQQCSSKMIFKIYLLTPKWQKVLSVSHNSSSLVHFRAWARGTGPGQGQPKTNDQNISFLFFLLVPQDFQLDLKRNSPECHHPWKTAAWCDQSSNGFIKTKKPREAETLYRRHQGIKLVRDFYQTFLILGCWKVLQKLCFQRAWKNGWNFGEQHFRGWWPPRGVQTTSLPSSNCWGNGGRASSEWFTKDVHKSETLLGVMTGLRYFDIHHHPFPMPWKLFLVDLVWVYYVTFTLPNEWHLDDVLFCGRGTNPNRKKYSQRMPIKIL